LSTLLAKAVQLMRFRANRLNSGTVNPSGQPNRKAITISLGIGKDRRAAVGRRTG
jgi:hypothetical protein